MSKTVGKIVMAISALSLTAAAFAGGPDHMAMSSNTPAASGNGSGFFLGAEAGMATTYSDITGNYTMLSGDTVSNAFNFANNSFLGGLIGGYQNIFANDVYLAVVGNVLFNSLNGTLTSQTVTDPVFGATTLSEKVKNNFQSGIDLRLGKKMGNVTPYLLGGVEAGSWKISTVASGASTGSASNDKTLVGPTAGAGVLFDVAHNWQADLEYAYTWCGSISTTSSVGSAKDEINQGQIMASASYLFS